MERAILDFLRDDGLDGTIMHVALVMVVLVLIAAYQLKPKLSTKNPTKFRPLS